MQVTLEHTDTTEIDKLNKEAWGINRKDAYKSIELSTKALEKSKQLNYKKGIALALKTLGTANIWISKNEEAIKYSFDAISIFKEINDKTNEAETCYYVGVSFEYLSDYDSAIKYYNECYNVNNTIGNEIGMANGLNGLGTVYYSIEQNDKALNVLLESEKFCIKHKDKEIYAKVLGGLGETYLNLKKSDLALECFNKSAAICSESGDKQGFGFVLDGIGRAYSATKKYDEALAKFNESLKIRRELGFKSGEVITLFNIGCLLIDKNDITESINYLEQSFKLAESINSKEGVYKASEKLAELHEKNGNLAECIKYYKIFQTTREEVRNEKTNQLIKSVELQHKMLQSQAEKLVLEEKAKELESYSDNLVLLGEIGQQIISHHSVAKIVETVYGHVNSLMDAAGFGIGLHKPEKNSVIFPLYIEGDDKFENIVYDLKDEERLTAFCFNKRKEIIINNYEKDILQYSSDSKAPLAGKRVESIIYLPLIYKDSAMGVITVQSFKHKAYSSYQVNILRNLAAYAAIALENARLYEVQENTIAERTKEVVAKKEEIEKAYHNNKLLSEVGQQITSTLNFEEIFDKLNNYVGKVMDAACFGIRLYDPVRNVVDYKYGMERGKKYSNIASISMNDDDNYSVWCIKHKKEIFLNDNLTEYSKYVKQIRVVSGDLPHSLIFYPIMIGERVLGVVTIQSFEKFAYKEHHLDILKSLASYIAIALENASLYENMEEKVKARTLEVVKQKEALEKANENTRILSQIGKDISTTFSINEIIDKVYENLNTLMDATCFSIGIFREKSNEIVFPATIEKKKHLLPYSYNLKDIDRPAVWCYTSQQDYIINSFSEEFVKSKKVKDFEAKEGKNPESIIYVPVTQNDKKIGVITVQSYVPNAYTNYHLQILKNLSVYVAIAIDNASLYNNLEQRVEERTQEIEKNYNDTRLLGQIAEDISSSLSVETIISKVYQNVNKLMKADCFGIGIVNPQNGMLEFKGFVENDQLMPDFGYSSSDPNRIAAICFTKKREIFINDYITEYSKYITSTQAPASGKDSASILYLPIYSKEKAIGVITVQSYNKNVYTEYHLNILKNLAVSIGIALDNASLYQNLEEKVKERTLEVVKQKEEVEKTYQNTKLLGQIGKDITSTLSISEIIEKVYTNVNALMDASVFAVAIYKQDLKKLVFSGTMEKGKKLDDFSYALEEDTLAVVCFNNDKEIFINDYEVEHVKYIKTLYNAIQGEDTESMIFLPIHGKNGKIGVLTVQSFNKGAYSEYQVNILKNLAVHIGIAFDNASLYENMEERVIERTVEVTKQKEQLEKNFQDTRLIAQITKDISASLSVETIVSKLYQNINNLMSSESFGIGLYNPITRSLQFSGFIERNERMDFFEFYIDDKDRYAVWCFDNEKEIIINDNPVEYSKYLKVKKAPIAGKSPESLIYLPLFTKDKKIGVLTVQSFSKDAYSEYQINILRNLALSIAIALDNANLYENLEDKVRERTEEVISQKAIIEEKNKDITDSIKYAKKIQLALMPDADILKQPFSESFVYYKPKDIVSGDFYWIETFKDGVTVFAAADCTGHGVPGAFMSLICNDLMGQVIKDQNVTSPAQVLTILDEKLRAMLNKSSDHSSNDGMDIALCAYYPKNMMLQFAGAHRPLLLIRNGELTEYKPSKHSIGGYVGGFKIFADNTIQLQKGDCVYVLTDGYSDQFGGESGKKFKFKKLQKLIQSIAHTSMDDQHDLLEEAFVSWRGKHEQVDDVCVIGVRV
ncbi:MAG TPA: GAF domain-containing protein [Bacteroidia bacterium]|jgi:transcriptional regulator with GAF, ATPase, and Fis domain|nr:GAF domain-containing protein [Bacteroidia bacterium]